MSRFDADRLGGQTFAAVLLQKLEAVDGARDDAPQVWLLDAQRWRHGVDAAQALLDPGERQRAARFHFAHDRFTYVLAHAAWRVLLSHRLRTPLSKLPLSRGAFGQPLLPGTDCSTSLSHSGSWIAVAIAATSTVGVDIESTPSRVHLADLQHLIATGEEQAQLQALDGPQRERALLNLWTQKEALLKAFGTGLEDTPHHLSAGPGPIAAPPSAAAQAACYAHALSLPAGLDRQLVGALALPLPTPEICIRWLQPQGQAAQIR